jgi:hypothetical protein
MLERGRPPTDWNDLMRECREWIAFPTAGTATIDTESSDETEETERAQDSKRLFNSNIDARAAGGWRRVFRRR